MQTRMRIQIPGIIHSFATCVWDFVDDTGAGSMSIFPCDIVELKRAANVRIQAFGYQRVTTANGKCRIPAYHLQIRMLANNDSIQLIDWTDIKVWVMIGQPTDTNIRMSGMWPTASVVFRQRSR